MRRVIDTPTHTMDVAGSAPTQDDIARNWRDKELARTDAFVPLTDHPQHGEYLTYRQALRDWPSTADFPLVRPLMS